MAPSNHSRKGKKAWRKNIDATEVEAFIEEETYKERREPAAETLADDQLFFVDTSADKEEAKAAQEGKLRKRKHEAKPLRSQEIIELAHKAKKVIMPQASKPVNSLTNRRGSKEAALTSTAAVKKSSPVSGSEELVDLWGEDVLALASANDMVYKPGPPKRPRLAISSVNSVKAVEVDMAGCSYNPDFEQHQDALAVVVASEMQKKLKKELNPTSEIPKMVPADGKPYSELDEYLVEDEGDDENEGDSSEEDGEGGAAAQKTKKKTKKDRLRQEKRKLEDVEVAKRRALKAQRRDLDRLKSLSEEVTIEQNEKESRLERRKADIAERNATLPPKLSKYRFEAPVPAVLTSDELTGGCLRRLAANPLLAADRFKNFQQRGLLEPRVRVAKKKASRVSYEKNGRREKAEAGQEEIRDLQRRTKALRKKIKRDQEKATENFF